jgi:hypothetical protein
MSLFQTYNAKGLIQSPVALSAGAVNFIRFDFTFTAAFAFATDQLELGVLPANCTICDAVLIGNAGGANTANVGLMTGTPGDKINARTISNELFAVQNINAQVARMSAQTGFNIAPVAYDRAIGLTTTANITAGTNNISLLMYYST